MFDLLQAHWDTQAAKKALVAAAKRKSEAKWHKKVVLGAAKERAKINRHLWAYAARQDGMVYRKIGEALGVSKCRASDLVYAGARLIKSRYTALNECAEIICRSRPKS